MKRGEQIKIQLTTDFEIMVYDPKKDDGTTENDGFYDEAFQAGQVLEGEFMGYANACAPVGQVDETLVSIKVGDKIICNLDTSWYKVVSQ